MKSADYKRIAKESLRGNWFSAIFASIIASVFGGYTLNSVNISLNVGIAEQTVPEGGETTASVLASSSLNGGDLETLFPAFIAVLSVLLAVSMVYAIVMLIVGGAVSIGYCQYNLDLIEDGKGKISTMFSCFDRMKTAIFVKLLTLLRVTIGFIFFIIPGIIASYSYYMANFVLADNPDMTAREALAESKRIMKGNKWAFFCLELSFLPACILCVLTLGIGFIWLVPKVQATNAVFYREARDRAGIA